MTARTSYGLDTPRGSHWADRAACGTPLVDPEWWWPMPGQAVPETQLALHICLAHCPALRACRRDARENPPSHPTVQGGVRFTTQPDHRVVPSDAVPTSTHGCPYCAGEAS